VSASKTANSKPEGKLNEIMVAMDVVDTLRHQQLTIDRELDDEARRERLLERLRKIYAGQGIDVPDSVLQEGIEALEKERFQYKKHDVSSLAYTYVRRNKWGKPLVALGMIAALVIGGNYFTQVLPKKRDYAAMPDRLSNTLKEIKVVAKNPSLVQAVSTQEQSALAALNSENLSQAKGIHKDMTQTLRQLQSAYNIKIVSRPGENSGVWRLAEINSNARNYYLIVEALDKAGKRLSLPITNEENGKIEVVSKWGVRVDEPTYRAVSLDKRDDGIIQGNLIGNKQVGYLKPNYTIKTTGGAITRWK